MIWITRALEVAGFALVTAGAWVLRPWLGLVVAGVSLILLTNYGWTEYGEDIEPEGEPTIEERLTELRRPVIPRLSRTG